MFQTRRTLKKKIINGQKNSHLLSSYESYVEPKRQSMNERRLLQDEFQRNFYVM